MVLWFYWQLLWEIISIDIILQDWSRKMILQFLFILIDSTDSIYTIIEN